MPMKPRRGCAFPGCALLAEAGQYCAQHLKETTSHYNRFQRDPGSMRRYGYAWKRIRDRYIRTHPFCAECEKQDRLTPAEEVHHILPLSKGGGNETTNLTALCKSCHSRITVENSDRWG